jgi:hypothetical protein
MGGARLFYAGKLWGWWDIVMVTGSADQYVKLGQHLEQVRVSFHLLETFEQPSQKDEKARARVIADCKDSLGELIKIFRDLGLSRAEELVAHAISDLPQTRREFEMLLRAVMADIRQTVFLFIPQHLTKYYDVLFQSFITTAFPLASKELVWAGNALAIGLYTASVFHSMRAAEIGVRVFGKELGVEFPDKPIELAEWQNILDQADSKIVKMKDMPRGSNKDDALNFYSQAAVQFRYFKDGWRVRVAHARESYEEIAATRVFNHTYEFFETLATRLKEPKPSV